MTKLQRRAITTIIPVDSEHNAILQIMTTAGLDFNNLKNSIHNEKVDCMY